MIIKILFICLTASILLILFLLHIYHLGYSRGRFDEAAELLDIIQPEMREAYPEMFDEGDAGGEP